MFDRDGDGNIHLSELARAARAYNELISKKDAYSLEAFPEHLHPTLATFDTNGDGSVSATELAHVCASLCCPSPFPTETHFSIPRRPTTLPSQEFATTAVKRSKRENHTGCSFAYGRLKKL